MSRKIELVPLKDQLVRPLTNGVLAEWNQWLGKRTRYPAKTMEYVRALVAPFHRMQVENWGSYGDDAILRAVALITATQVAFSTERYHGNPPLWGHAAIGALANLQSRGPMDPIQGVVSIDWRPRRSQVINERELGVIGPWISPQAGLFWGAARGKVERCRFSSLYRPIFTNGDSLPALVQANPSDTPLAWELPDTFNPEDPDDAHVQSILRLLGRGLGNSCSNGTADARASKGISAAVICGNRVYRSVNNKNHEKGNCDCAEKTAAQLAVSYGEKYIDAIIIYTPHFTMRDGDGKVPAILRVCGGCLEVLAQHISLVRRDVRIIEYGAEGLSPRSYWLRERLKDSFTWDEAFQAHGREALAPVHHRRRRS